MAMSSNVAQTSLKRRWRNTDPGAKVLVPSKSSKTYETEIPTENCCSFLNPHLPLQSRNAPWQWKAQGKTSCHLLEIFQSSNLFIFSGSQPEWPTTHLANAEKKLAEEKQQS